MLAGRLVGGRGGRGEEAELPAVRGTRATAVCSTGHPPPEGHEALGSPAAAAHVAPPVRAFTRPRGWPSPALTAVLAAKPSRAFGRSPCLSKKQFVVILQEGVCCIALHDKYCFKQALFSNLCI